MKIYKMKTKRYSALYRILHWAIALSFVLLIVTIFLRLTWMNKYTMANIMGDFLKDNTDVHLSHDQLILMAKQIRINMWVWHFYIGYVLTGLFVVRFALPLFGHVKFQNPLESGLTKVMRLQRWMYIVFYICVVITLVTGFFLLFGARGAGYKPIMKFLHVNALYFLIPFIVLHLGGVLYSEFTDKKGIISRIISGSRKKNQD